MYNNNNSILTNNVKGKSTTWQQDLLIASSQLLNPINDVVLGVSTLSIPYLNSKICNIKPFIDGNNVINILKKILQLENTPIIKDISLSLVASSIPFCILAITILRPYNLNKKAKDCKNLEITDNGKKDGNTIIPIRSTISFKDPRLKKIICYSNGVLADDFKVGDKLQRLSRKWKRFVVDAEDYKEDKLIIYYRRHKSNKMLFWKNEYLSKNDFELVLGEDSIGKQEIINLNSTPHLIISSTSGGGKTTLFKCVLMQSYLKGALCLIIDMKGLLDFSKGWQNLKNCKLIDNVNDLYDVLENNVMVEAERRKNLLNKYCCKDIEEFNFKIENKEIEEEKLQRIVIGLDEASQVFSKARNKKIEEQLNIIREDFEKITELFRAVGIHLIISTQVPSSQVLSEKIRHNCDFRVCGRANRILSSIVIDSEEASKIPKSSRGQFITNEGKKFQGYIFYEKDVFDELKQVNNKNYKLHLGIKKNK